MKDFKELMMYLNRLLNNSTNWFLVSGELTWVDFLTAEFYETFSNLVPGLFDDYPKIASLYEKVHGLPQIQDYLKNRPKTNV